jgi:hypothetical protein
MRRQLIAAAVVTMALVLAGTAAAKGPESASLSGPGLDGSLRITGQGEMGTGTPLGSVVDLGGFFAQMYGQAPDPTTRARPHATFGPRYLITYVVPGPNRIKSRVVQVVYPYAKPAPLTYMKTGQHFWGTRRTHGGWFTASADLTRVLIKVGLPARG